MAMKQMDWNKLLSGKRLGREKYREDAYRPSFQRDFDRIIFSSAFRRLQDKTQFFPLGKSDYVRARLRHSLEVACVGRSLGAIIAAACLAHDVDNPPLGHSGEEAIRHWFNDSRLGRKIIGELSMSQKKDFKEFEGNALSFLVEAADDITYRIIDFEDGFSAMLLSSKENKS